MLKNTGSALVWTCASNSLYSQIQCPSAA